MNPIPYSEIKTLFIDAGNTLVSIDFPWVCEELAKRDITCTPEELQRAEAAARPDVSKELRDVQTKETLGVFGFYFKSVLQRLPEDRLDSVDLDQLTRDFVPVLMPDGKSQRLWSYILPGVEEALQTLDRLNLQLVVVSNSDGTIEASLTNLGLSSYFDEIVDSHVIGVEKPNPKIFEHALSISNAKPETTLHVGDIYDIDVVGARSAGVHAVLLDPYDDWQNVDCEKAASLLELSERMKHSKS